MLPTLRAALCAALLAGLTFAAAPPMPRSPSVGYWPQWRGHGRLNVSSETKLLGTWPKDGPPLAWQTDGVGEGVGSVAVAGGRVYLVGQRGRYECLTALDEATGKPVWSAALGVAVKQYEPMRWLSQRTPLIDGDRAYGFTAAGEVVCVAREDGKPLWSKDYAKDFAGRRGGFGWCDQLLIDGDRLICVPGGKDATVVALNKRTGEVVWKAALDAPAQYVGAVLAGGGEVPKHYVAVTGRGLIGVSTEGKELWRNTRFSNTTANSHTPNCIGDLVFSPGNYGRGIVLLRLSKDADGVKATEEYHHTQVAISSWHEMVTVVGDHAYVGGNNGVCCMEWKTGKVLWKEVRTSGGLGGPVSGTCADGRLYLFNQKGEAALVEASEKGFSLKGKFSVPDTARRAGATSPVVAGGRLYLRRDNRLFCYQVREGVTIAKALSHTVPPLSLDARLPRRGGSDSEAIFVPTPAEAVERMLKLAKVGKGDTLVDLGSGDGRILIAAAKAHGCRAVGYEIDEALVKQARAAADKEGVEKLVTIEQKDMYTADLSKADVVTLYLPPPALKKLLPQLKKLPAGARVVSHAFAIPGAKAAKTEKVESKETGLEHTLYLYTAPLGE